MNKESLGLFTTGTLAAVRARVELARRCYPSVLAGTPEVSDLTDMFRLPVMTKADCALPRLPLGPENALLFHSGGSSGSPSYYYITPAELCEKGRIATALLLDGMPDPGPKRYLYLNLMSGGGGWSGHVVSAVGAHPWSIAFSPVNRGPEETLRLTARVLEGLGDRLAGIVMLGVPAALLDLAECLRKRGMHGWPVRRIAFGAAGLAPAQADRLLSTFPGATIHSILSSSEGNAYGFSAGDDFHVLKVLPDSCFLWIRDEASGLPIEEAGLAGELVVTNLYCRYHPVNFLTNDLASWLSPYESYRFEGRKTELIALMGGGVDRLEAREVAEIVLRRSDATACQIHVFDGPAIEVFVRGAKRVLGEAEIRRIVCEVATSSNAEEIMAHLRISMRDAVLDRTAAGKTPLVVDHRET